MKFKTKAHKSFSLNTLIVLLLVVFSHPHLLASRILHTEKNGFQWYLDDDRPAAYSIDNKLLMSGYISSDKISYFCYDAEDPGRFILSKYIRGGGHINNLYDSNGNLIAKLDIQHSVDQVLCEVKRIKFQDSYYFFVKDYRKGDYYGVIDDNGYVTVPFSRQELSDNVTNGKGGHVTLDGCLFIGNYSDGFGLIRPNGQVIIPIASENWRIGFGSEYIKFSTNHDVSLLDNTGNFIIKGVKRIEEVNGQFSIEDQVGNKGLYTFDGNCIVSPDLGFCDFKEFVGPNKARYFLVKETSSNLFGVVNENWDELFPCEFENIEYIGGDFFKFKSGPNWGVVTTKGKVIIPTSRGYSSIGKYSSIQKRIPFTKPGYTGECNSLGTQVSLIKAPSTGSRTGTSSNPSNKTQVTQKNSVSGNIIPSENNDKFWYSRYGDAKFDSTGDKIISTNYVYPSKDFSFEIQFEYKTNKTVTIYLNEIKGNNSISRISTIGTYKISDSKSVVLKTNSVNFFSLTHHVVVDNSGAIIIYNISRGKYVSAKIFQPNGTTESIYKIRYDVLCSKLR